MKNFIFTLLTIFFPIVSMAQVENTPFKDGVEKTWQFVQEIGYNTEIEISYDTTHVALYNSYPVDKVYKHYKAKNPTDNSMVDLVEQIDEEFGNTFWNVLYTWKEKKTMPKILKGVKQEFYIKDGAQWHIKRDGYKNSYAVGIVGNPNRPIRFADVHYFYFYVNGISYSGWY